MAGRVERRGAAAPALSVTVIRSAKRRKTVQARLVDGRLVMRIPARMSATEEQHWVEEMKRRFTAKRSSGRVDLTARAATLAARHRLPRATSVRWVSNQHQRWGSCTVATGDIRLSERLADFPTWVLDYVIVHELAHLVVADHGPRFQALVDRYPRAERARGFLIAKSGDDGSGDPDDGGPAPSDDRRLF